MLKRAWTVISVGFGAWSILNTLKKMEASRNELVDEFYSTLTPEEQKMFKNIFGSPGIPKIETPLFPQVQVPVREVIAPTQVEILEAKI